MAGLLDLFGGGGSDPYDIYGDLFTDKQKAAMREQQQGQGLLRMAAALGQAAMPSRMPVPIGAVLGSAAGALGTGQDAQMEQMLKAAQTAELVRQSQATRDLQKQISPFLLRLIQQQNGLPAGSLGTSAPAAPAPAAPGSPNTPAGGLPPGAMTSIGDPAQMVGLLAQPGAAGPPDQVIGQGQGLIPRLAAGYGGDANAPLPFSLASLGGSGSGSPDTADATPEELRKLGLIRQYESGNRNIMQQVVGPQGGYNPSVGRVTGPSSASGYYQMIDPTYRHAAALAGIDTQQYPRAIDAPPDLQDKAALALLREQGTAPWAPYNANLRAALGGRTGGRFAGMGPARSGGGAPDTVLPSGDNSGLAALTALSGLLGLSGGGSGGGGLPDLASLVKLTSGPGGLSMPPSSGGGGPTPDAAGAGSDQEVPPAPSFQQPLSPQQYRAQYGQAYPPGVLERGVPGSGGGAVPAPPPAAAPAMPLATPPGAGAALATPPGVPAALATPQGTGLIPGVGMTPQGLAALNALTEMAKLGTPFKSLLETYYKSPEYLQQSAGATARGTKGVELQFDPLIEGAKTASRLQQEQIYRPALEAAIEKAKNDPLLDRAEKQAQIDRYTKSLEQLGTAQTTTTKVTVSVGGQPREITVTNAQARDLAAGKGIPELGIPPGAASMMGTPAYTETEKAIGANAAKAFGEQRDAAQTAAQQIKINNESLRLLDSGLYTGWDANLAMSMARVFGIGGKDTAEKVQNTQLFIIQRMQQAAEAVRAQPGSASDKDLAFANKMAVGDITLEPNTIRQGMEIYNRFNLEKIREHNKNAAQIPPGVTSGIRQTVDEPPAYERSQGNTPGGNRWTRPPGQ